MSATNVVLIQNNGRTPLFKNYPTGAGRERGQSARLLLEPGQVTRIPIEIYKEFVQKCPFFQRYFNNGTLRVLGPHGAQDQQETNALAQEALYMNFVTLCQSCDLEGGASNPQVAPYLNEDGTPTIAIAQKNLGLNLPGETYDSFRLRYVTERDAGMHKFKLQLPTGGLVQQTSTVQEQKEPAPVEAPNSVLNDQSDLPPPAPAEAVAPAPVSTTVETVSEQLAGYDLFVSLCDTMPQDDSDFWTNENGPDVRALSSYGLELTAKERNEFWKQYQAGK